MNTILQIIGALTVIGIIVGTYREYRRCKRWRETLMPPAEACKRDYIP